MTAASPPTQAAPLPALARRRYPGVRSFAERDQAQFRGRKLATEELLLRVLSVRLLLQFAPSGVGKTSLLTAGLFPRLRPRDYFPFIVRLNETRESLVDAVRRSLADAAHECGLVDPVIPPRAETLWALLSGTQLWSQDLLLLTPVLVFDQFEEVFSLRDAAFRAEFGRQVGEFAGSSARGEAPPPAKFIISLREEYLGKLEEFSTSIPELFRERLRLSPMSADEARRAIIEPAALPGDDWASPQFGYTDGALALLIDFIDGASENVKLIEPLTLQLVCQHAEDMVIARGADAAPLALEVNDFGGLPGLERLVREYYRQVLDRIAAPDARRRAQLMFEEGLLDPAGKRLMLEQGEIEREYRLDVPTLDALVASSLLRREPRNESVFYEISHDRLTDTIARQRKPRLPRWVMPALGVGVLIMLIVTWAWWQQRNLTGQAEYAVEQLLGEKLVSRLREVGLSDALRQILEQVNNGAARDDYAAGLASVLQWRHAGDIERERGTLDKSRALYERALATLDGLPAATPGSAQTLLLAERARIFTALGSLAANAGEVTKAGTHFAEAQRLWDATLQASPVPRPQDLLDAADSRNSHANLLTRTGDYDGAETQALAAARLSTRVWSTAYDGRYSPSFDANFDIGRGIQVFADSVLNLSGTTADVALADTAVQLAREAVRLRPLSFQARRQLGTAIANRFFSVQLPTSPEEWVVLRVESRRHFADLGQSDPDNLSMRREQAAVELVIAESVALCLAAPAPTCRHGIPADAAELARVAVLETTGIIRRLAAADPANRSLKFDVSWGLRVQSRLAAIDDAAAATALRRLDDAIAIEASVPLEAGDVGWRWSRAKNLVERARLVVKAHRPAEAKAFTDAAWAEIDGTPSDTRGAREGRIDVLNTSKQVLREAGLTMEAEALQAKLNALKPSGNGPRQTSYDAALKANEQAIQLAKVLDPQDAVRNRADRATIESLHAQAVTEYPYNATMWSNLSIAQSEVASNGTPAVEGKTAAARDAALRGSVAAAWMANVLEPNDKHLDQLYAAHRSLAKDLRDRGGAGAELLALTERCLTEAKELARKRPDTPNSLFYLADANLGVALVRESVGVDGWDEAFRVAFLHGERLAGMQSGDANRQIWLGTGRSYLAGLLDDAKLASEAAQQRQLALTSCRKALALPTASAEEREKAQSCLNELAAAGVK